MQYIVDKCNLQFQQFFFIVVTTEGKLSIWNPFETSYVRYIDEISENESNQALLEIEAPELKLDVKDEGYLSCEFCNHGNLVAVADQCGYAYVYELCMPLPKLSQFCRNVIRKNLVKEKNNATINSVNELYCIPKSVKSFLSYDSCT